MAIKASENIKQYIREKEKFVSKAYPDSKTGKTAIGYGDTSGDNSKPITLDEAERRLQERVKIAEDELSPLISKNLTQSQQDALIDQHYNMGLTKMTGFGLIDLVNKATDEEISQNLLKYNKSYNVDTGRFQVEPSLVERTQDRSKMWQGKYWAPTQEGPTSGQTPSKDSDLFAGLDAFPENPTANDDLFIDLDSVDVSSPGPKSPEEKAIALQQASSAANIDDWLKSQEARVLAARLDIPENDARAMLQDRTAQDIYAEERTGMTALHFPANAEWAREPQNYALMKQTGDFTRKLEAASTPLNVEAKSDMLKALKDNKNIFEDTIIQLRMATGSLSVEEGSKILSLHDIERSQETFSQETIQGMKEIDKAFESLTPATIEILKGFTGDDKELAQRVRQVFSGVADAGESAYEIVKSIIMNPEAFAVKTTQSASGTITPLAVGAAATAVATPVAGVTATLITGGVLGFSGYMSEQLEEFRDPATGRVNYSLAFGDPARVRKWREAASLYGLVSGIGDVFYGKVAGKLFSKNMAKSATSTAGKVAQAATGVALEGTVKAGEEVATEFTASNVADLYKDGELTPETIAKNTSKAAEEGVFSFGHGAVIGAVGYGAKKVLKTPRAKIATTDKIINDSNSATDALTDISHARSVKESEPQSAQYPEQVSELVNQTTDIPPVPEDIHEAVTPEVPTEALNEEKVLQKYSTSNSVMIAPSEFVRIHEMRGNNVTEEIGKFSPLVQSQFQENLDSDSSINITIGEWLRFTEADPEIDAIARINGNEYNGIEANKNLDAFSANPFTLYDMDIQAFHGSPHDFDKFKESEINTGEGAQAFGNGLYFSTDRGVAEGYRSRLNKEFIPTFKEIKNYYKEGEVIPSYGGFQKVLKFNDNGGAWNVEVISVNQDGSPIEGSIPRRHSTPPSRLEIKRLTGREQGQVFEVKLAPGLWIDLNATIDSVPPEVIKDLRDSLKAIDEKPKESKLSWDNIETSQPPTEEFKDFMKGDSSKDSSAQIGQIISWLTGDQDKALSAQLASKGISGFTYVGSESGKRNYVVFSEDSVKIVKKFYGDETPINSLTLYDMELPPTPDQDSDTPPEVPMSAATAIDESSLGSRSVELVQRGKTDESQKILRSLRNQISSAVEGAISPEAVNALAELQLRNINNRAEVLEVSPSDIAGLTKVTKKPKGKSKGEFKGRTSPLDPVSVMIDKNSSVKTVIHELSHSWLYQLAEDFAVLSNKTELTVAQEEYARAMADAADLLGLNNIGELLTLDDAQYERAQETFASTAEDYMVQGNFSNTKAVFLMEKLRSWVKDTMQSFMNVLRRFPALEITPKVERMMEGIIGISNKVEDAVYPIFPTPLFDPSIMPESYRQAIEQAESLAVSKVYEKAWNKEDRLREKEIDANIDRIINEATVEADLLPPMQYAGAALRDWNDYKAERESFQEDLRLYNSLAEPLRNELIKPEPPTDPRISFESIQRELFNGDEAMTQELKDSIPSHIMTSKKKGGVDVSEVMFAMNFNQPEDFLAFLADTGKRDQFIEEITDRKIAEEFPVMKSDDEIHGIAEREVQAVGREKMLSAELKILAEQYLPQLKGAASALMNPASYVARAAKDVLKAKGRSLVVNSPVVKFGSKKFLIDSNRMGRETARYFKRNDIIGAFNFKEKEAIQFYAYQDSLKAVKQIAKTYATEKKIMKYAKAKDFTKIYDADVMAYARYMIQAVQKGDALPSFDKDILGPYSAVNTDQIKKINESIASFQAQANGRYGENFTVGGYISFGELLGDLMFVAKEAKEVEVLGTKMLLEEVSDAVTEEFSQAPRVVNFERGNVIQNIVIDTTIAENVFASMYPSREAYAESVMGDLNAAIRIGESNFNNEFNEKKNRITDALRKAYKADKSMMGILAPIINRIPGAPSVVYKLTGRQGLDQSAKPVQSKVLNIKLKNKAEALFSVLLLGSESGTKKFLLGGTIDSNGPLASLDPFTNELDMGIRDRYISELIEKGVLTKEDMDALQAIWDVMDEIHPRVKEVTRKTEGYNIGKVDGLKISTPFGEYRGGYVPVSNADRNSNTGVFNDIINVEAQGYSASELYGRFNDSMTNRRKDNYYPVNLDMSRTTSYMAAALQIVHLREPLMNFGKVMNVPEVRETFNAQRPGAIQNVLEPWAQRVAKQQYSEYDPNVINDIARKLRKNSNVATYFLNISSGAKQILGAIPALNFISPKFLLQGSLDTALNTKAVREEIVSKSKYMTDRFDTSTRRSIQSWEELDSNFDWVRMTDDKVQKATYVIVQGMQNLVDTTVWRGSYLQSLSEGKSEATAIKLADDAVKSSQSDANVSSLSNLQAGKEIQKLFTMVSTVPITISNSIRTESNRQHSDEDRNKVIATMGFVAVILPTVIDAVISASFNGSDDEEDEDLAMQDRLKTIAQRTVFGSLDYALPVFTRPIGSAIMYGKGSIGPAISALDNFGGAFAAADNLTSGVTLNAREWKAITNAATTFTGIPFSGVGRLISIEETLQDEDTLLDRQAERRELINLIKAERY